MRKRIALLICVAMAAAVLCGCSTYAETDMDQTSSASTSGEMMEPAQDTGDASQAEEEQEPDGEADGSVIKVEAPEMDTNGAYLVLDASDAYEGAYSFMADKTGIYTFQAENAEGYQDISWSIYVLPEKFDDGLRYLKQAYDPEVVVADGSAEACNIEAGKYIYCECSLNVFTDDKVIGAGTLAAFVSEIEVPEKPSDTTQPENTWQVDTADYCDSGWYVFTVPQDGICTVSTTSAQAEWSFYVLDEEFDEAFRYLSQAYESVLTGDGSFEVAAGQYVYCRLLGEVNLSQGECMLSFSIQ